TISPERGARSGMVSALGVPSRHDEDGRPKPRGAPGGAGWCSGWSFPMRTGMLSEYTNSVNTIGRRLARKTPRRLWIAGTISRAGGTSIVSPGLTGETDDLLPRASIALRRVEVGEPPVAARGHALEHGIDVAADQYGRPRALARARPHHGLAQVVLVDLQRHAVFRPEPRE